MKIIEKLPLKSPKGRIWLRRLFPAVIVIAILVTIVGELASQKCIPTWQIYTEESRQGTLVSYQEPNDRGESLYIQASLMDVDFTAKTYKIHFLLEPNGTLAGDNGVVSQNLTLSLYSMKYIHFPAGESMEPVEIVFDYDFGNDVDYPFDQYSGYFEIMAAMTGNISATVPISFKLEASVTTYSFNPSFRQFNYETDKIGLKIVAGRSTTTLGFSIFICILMWALSLVIALISYQVVLRGRRVDAHSTMLGITMLFALPALRSAQPGIPPVGCAADILGFYWNMAIIACSAVAITMCWAVRWRPEANDKMSIMSVEEARFDDTHYDDTRYDDNATACGSTCPPVRRCVDNVDDDIYEIGDEDSTTIAGSSPSTSPDRRRQY
ncbi:hypothetical protein INT43_007831 [Umbelopsis isabellina]|uniref:Uncharacterized protein n=1 Tax=Mortierella isabellina TaxID=91625 RepID=A0A8H7UF87_MORIS|nr:hypothetical protein INT43_007831 [Umbelopsis isabellina]